MAPPFLRDTMILKIAIGIIIGLSGYHFVNGFIVGFWKSRQRRRFLSELGGQRYETLREICSGNGYSEQVKKNAKEDFGGILDDFRDRCVADSFDGYRSPGATGPQSDKWFNDIAENLRVGMARLVEVEYLNEQTALIRLAEVRARFFVKLCDEVVLEYSAIAGFTEAFETERGALVLAVKSITERVTMSGQEFDELLNIPIELAAKLALALDSSREEDS